MKVGFIGIGIMGRPMALNLLRAGHSLSVYDAVPGRCQTLVAAGALEAGSPREVAGLSEVIITMVPDAPQVEDALFGANGAAHGITPGKIVIDMSSISPKLTLQFAARLAALGCEMLDAPVTGGEPGAIEARLAIMAGGKPEIYEKCLPLLQVMGKTIVHAGPNGAGQKMKIVNQVVGSLNVLAMVEGIRLAQAAGLDLDAALKVVGGGAASSWMVVNLGPKVAAGDFAPGFMLKLHQKDLRVASEFIQELGAEFPGTKLAYELFTEALKRGLGDQGNQGLYNLWSE